MTNRTELEKLQNGLLFGTKQLRLTNLGLTNFPTEIFSLADSLELLDLSGNKLNQIPDEIVVLKKLKIAFFSFNDFEVFPKILSQLPHLEMIGFKSNRIQFIPENAFPPKLRWLILTQNEIESLPKSIGSHIRLQKLMLAGNKLNALPHELKNCSNLELLRISANKFEQMPAWIWEMPRLAWLAYSGNIFNSYNTHKNINSYDYNNFEIHHKLGEGASGIISKATYLPTDEGFALKIFKGEITSDGLPENELLACIKASSHPNLIPIIGTITNHPELKMGLVLDLLPDLYKNLGNPPSFETCTRDVFSNDIKFSINQIVKIVLQTAETCLYFHQNNIMHGDLYAHNILINDAKHIFVTDFGAATIYTENESNNEKLEVRAWACLLEDLIQNCYIKAAKKDKNELFLIILLQQCFDENVANRPDFLEIIHKLKSLN